jgi:hypothetical protein
MFNKECIFGKRGILRYQDARYNDKKLGVNLFQVTFIFYINNSK